MAAPNPKLYEEGTLTDVSPVALGTITAGTNSATWEWDLWNENAASEDLTEVLITCLESDDGGTTWHQTGQVTNQRWVQVQAYDVIDTNNVGIVGQTTDLSPIGYAAFHKLLPIPGDTARKLRFRVDVPVGASSAGKSVKIIVWYSQKAHGLGLGSFEAGRHGVFSGVADLSFGGLIAGGTMAETGTPDGNVQVTDTTIWRYKGETRAKYAHAIAITASTAGKARWVTISAGATGTFTLTESTEVTAPAPVSDRPLVPTDETLLGYVHRDDGTIVNADIYQDDRVLSCFGLETTGLTATVGRGDGLTANRYVIRDKPSDLTLTASATNTIWILPAGGYEITTGTTDPSSRRAEALWEVTTSGSAETARRDLRRWLGPPIMRFEAYFAGTVAASDTYYHLLPGDKEWEVRLPRGVGISAGVLGDRTAGEVRWDLEYYDEGTNGWVSLFSATAGQPVLDHSGGGIPDPAYNEDAVPDTVQLPVGSRKVRWIVDNKTLSGGTTDPADFVLSAELWELGR